MMTTASTDETRRTALHRMRLLATGLLVLMAVIFIASSLGQHHWAWLGWVRAFSEAAMVGACADWFAVTALFRQPLGLPIPHTGIVPRNRDRIGDGMGTFIADNFLTEDILNAKLDQFEIAHAGGVWLAEPAQANSLARRFASAVPELRNLLPADTMRDLVGSMVFAAANAMPAAPATSKILSVAWNEGRSQATLDWLVEKLTAYFGKHEDIIHGRVGNQTARWMPKFVDRLIASKITAGIYEILKEMKAPDHPWRVEIRVAIEDFIDRLQNDPELGRQAEEIKQSILQEPRLHEQAAALWENLDGLVPVGDADALANRIETLLIATGRWLQSNGTAQTELNMLARNIIGQIIAPRRHAIGRFVAQVVAGWDRKNIADKLELQFGPDLQYIRINGTLVGGLVGLAIYAVSMTLGL